MHVATVAELTTLCLARVGCLAYLQPYPTYMSPGFSNGLVGDQAPALLRLLLTDEIDKHVNLIGGTTHDFRGVEYLVLLLATHPPETGGIGQLLKFFRQHKFLHVAHPTRSVDWLALCALEADEQFGGVMTSDGNLSERV